MQLLGSLMALVQGGLGNLAAGLVNCMLGSRHVQDNQDIEGAGCD